MTSVCAHSSCNVQTWLVNMVFFPHSFLKKEPHLYSNSEICFQNSSRTGGIVESSGYVNCVRKLIGLQTVYSFGFC